MKILAIEGSTRHPSSTLTHVEALLAVQANAESKIVRLSDRHRSGSYEAVNGRKDFPAP